MSNHITLKDPCEPSYQMQVPLATKSHRYRVEGQTGQKFRDIFESIHNVYYLCSWHMAAAFHA